MPELSETMSILYGTIDPTTPIERTPAMTTMLHRVCGDDSEKFHEATRLIELFIAEALKRRRDVSADLDAFERVFMFTNHIDLARRILTAVSCAYTEDELDDIGRRARHWVLKAYREWMDPAHV